MEEGKRWNCPSHTHTALLNEVELHSASWKSPASLEGKYISILVEQVTSPSCNLHIVTHLNEKIEVGR